MGFILLLLPAANIKTFIILLYGQITAEIIAFPLKIARKIQMKKIFNIPNSISILRTIIIVPLIVYFFVIGENILALILSLLTLSLDVLDGYLARKFKQETKTGVFLDMMADNILIAAIVITFVIIGYIDLIIFSLIAAHRVTRLALASYFWINAKGFYKPVHIKLTGVILFIHIFTIPLLVEYFGQQVADIATYTVVLATHLALLTATIRAVIKHKKGTLEIVKK
ncbi:hypothetical protein GF366_01445 [Candidatus Peregrinibacteria bacterium]|nr:hypothetical protein [Candidatus Peregrinibacteria bacterium]